MNAPYTFAVALTVLVVALSPGCSAEAQTEFKTLDRVFWVRTGTNRALLKEEKSTDCRFPTENLRAEDDPSGNWGFPSEGLQMSLRFNKMEFPSDEAIIASILVRNVHDSMVTDVSGDPDGTQFLVTDQNNGRLNRKDLAGPDAPFAERLKMTTHSMSEWPLEVATQRKYKLIVSDMFDLTRPDTYLLRAHRWVRRLDGSDRSELMSGVATIRVVASNGSNVPGSQQPRSTDSAAGASSATPSVPGQTASVSPPGATANAGSEPSGDTASTEARPPASSDNGRSIPGNFAEPARIAASVLVLLLSGAVLVFLAVRRSRRRV